MASWSSGSVGVFSRSASVEPDAGEDLADGGDVLGPAVVAGAGDGEQAVLELQPAATIAAACNGLSAERG